MPNSKSHRRGQEEKNRRVKLAEKPSSLNGRTSGAMVMGEQLIRPRTVPDLLSGGSLGTNGEQLRRPGTVPDLLSGRTVGGSAAESRPLKLTKLLLNVTMQRSLGAVQVVMSPESTVGDLIAAALRLYEKEGRRPILPSTDPSGFGLHYSQFSLESLDPRETLKALGSRNFFVCPKELPPAAESGGFGGGLTKTPSCSKQAEQATKTGLPWLKFSF